MNNELIKKFFDCDQVEALCLGGSRATGNYDENSDYDYYVYLVEPISEQQRMRIIDGFVSYMEYSNTFWELEDDGRFINGIEVEFIYRSINDLEEMMDNLLVKGNVSLGYSTCFVDNLLNSKIIFDKKKRLEKLKNKCSMMLTNHFFDKIIYKNFPLLMDKMPSMYYQIEKACKRDDLLSMNHRSAAYFEIYFDIIFALNRVTHPGEKKMLEIAKGLDLIPSNMGEDIKEYFEFLFVDNKVSLKILEVISEKIYDLLIDNGYNLSLNTSKKKR